MVVHVMEVSISEAREVYDKRSLKPRNLSASGNSVSFMQYGVTLKILNSEYSQSFYNSKYIASLLIDSNEPFYIFLFLWYFPNQVIRRNTKLWVAFCFEKVLNTAVYMILFLLQIQCGFRKTQYVDLFISGFKIDFKI